MMEPDFVSYSYVPTSAAGRSLPVAAQHPELPLSARNQSYRLGFSIFKSERLLLRQQQTKNLVNYWVGIRQKTANSSHPTANCERQLSACEHSADYCSSGSIVSVSQAGRCALLGSPMLRSTPSGSGGGGAGQASGSALVCLTTM